MDNKLIEESENSNNRNEIIKNESKGIDRVKRPFLKEEKGVFKKEEVVVKELKPYVLLLMKNNGYSEFIEDRTPGQFLIEDKDTGKEKTILLSPNKITTFVYNNQYFKGWVAHEDNMTPYPQDPIHNSNMFREVIQKLVMNYKDINEIKGMEQRRKTIITIVLLVIVVIFIAFVMLKNSGVIGAKTVAKAGTVVAKEVIRNSTGVVVG